MLWFEFVKAEITEIIELPDQNPEDSNVCSWKLCRTNIRLRPESYIEQMHFFYQHLIPPGFCYLPQPLISRGFSKIKQSCGACNLLIIGLLQLCNCPANFVAGFLQLCNKGKNIVESFPQRCNKEEKVVARLPQCCNRQKKVVAGVLQNCGKQKTNVVCLPQLCNMPFTGVACLSQLWGKVTKTFSRVSQLYFAPTGPDVFVYGLSGYRFRCCVAWF